MNWNEHFNIRGKHALLSASGYHWLNYSPDKMEQVYLNNLAKQRGTELHALAAEMIRLGIKAQNTKQTFNMYVNDAIGYKMIPEQVLYYSDNCFGTADAIAFNERKKLLRINDLKTGVSETHFEQLFIYDALFCLEYGYSPNKLKIINSIYQNDEVRTEEVSPDIIMDIMAAIERNDTIINKLKMMR